MRVLQNRLENHCASNDISANLAFHHYNDDLWNVSYSHIFILSDMHEGGVMSSYPLACSQLTTPTRRPRRRRSHLHIRPQSDVKISISLSFAIPRGTPLVVSLAMAPLNVYVSFYSSLFKSLFTLAFARLYTPQKPSKRDLSGQTAIVTGANSGIGLSIAVQFVAISKGEERLSMRLSQEPGRRARVKCTAGHSTPPISVV